MAHEFKVKNALQILNTQPITGITNDPSSFDYNEASTGQTVATMKATKDYVDSVAGGKTTVDAWNGLTKTDNSIGLGGNLTTDIDINGNGQYDITLQSPYYNNLISQYRGTQLKFDSASGNIYFYSVHDDRNYTSIEDGNSLRIHTTTNQASYYSTGFSVDNRGSFTFGASEGLISSLAAGFKGLIYAYDYSTNFVDRSLVDKAYVDSVAGGGGITWSTPVDANIVPLTSNTYNLGEEKKAFKKLYLTNGIYVKHPTIYSSEARFVTQGASLETVTLGVNAGEHQEFDAYFATLIGSHAGNKLTTGPYNTFLGQCSGYGVSTGGYNTFLGFQTGAETNGSRNVFIGYDAGKTEQDNDKLIIANSNTTDPLIYGDFDASTLTINGTLSTYDILPLSNATYNLGSTIKKFEKLYLSSTGGIYDSFAGDVPILTQGTGIGSLTVGADAGKVLEAGGDSSNTLIGYAAGIGLTTGTHNVMLGTLTGVNNSTGVGNVFIGNRAGNIETGSNRLYIANSDTSTPLIKGFFDVSTLHVNGKLYVNGSSPGSGEFFVAGESGVTNGGSFRVWDGSIRCGKDLVVDEVTYIGEPTSDGSWRYLISGDDLLYQRRVSGSWVTKQTIVGA